MVTTLFPKDAFDGIWGLSQFPPKPNPAIALHAADTLGVAPCDCLFVGDSALDMIIAKKAGMCAVGVSWGYRPVAELSENGADHIIHLPAELELLALGVD